MKPPEHDDHDAPWFCLACDRPVCPTCEVSPAEQELCSACYWISDPDGSAE